MKHEDHEGRTKHTKNFVRFALSLRPLCFAS